MSLIRVVNSVTRAATLIDISRSVSNQASRQDDRLGAKLRKVSPFAKWPPRKTL